MSPERPADPVRSAADSLFWAALCLAGVLIVLKAGYLGVHGAFRGAGILGDVRSLAAISHADLLFVTAFWICGRTLLAVSGDRPWIGRSIVIVWIACAAAVCLYAVASVIAFGALGGFLTYALVHQVGNVRMLSSSVTAYLTTPVLLTLGGVPIAYIVLVLATRVRARGHNRGWLPSAVTCAAIALWIAVGHHAYATDWITHYDWRIADNAPWVLAVSWWQAANTERPVHLTDAFPAGDLTDFEPIGQRKPRVAAPAGPRGRPLRAATAARGAAARPLNVVLLVLESVAERWTSFGGIYDTTPNLVKEAAHGLVVDHFYAHVGRSSNSLVALLLSVYPKLNFRDFTEEYPRVERTSLATALSRARVPHGIHDPQRHGLGRLGGIPARARVRRSPRPACAGVLSADLVVGRRGSLPRRRVDRLHPARSGAAVFRHGMDAADPPSVRTVARHAGDRSRRRSRTVARRVRSEPVSERAARNRPPARARVRRAPPERPRRQHDRRRRRRSRSGVRLSARQLPPGPHGVRGRRAGAAAHLVSAPICRHCSAPR